MLRACGLNPTYTDALRIQLWYEVLSCFSSMTMFIKKRDGDGDYEIEASQISEKDENSCWIWFGKINLG